MPQVYFDDEGPTEHDAHLLDNDTRNDLVSCPQCGKAILAVADRCHRCGARFETEAWLATRSSKAGLYMLAAVAVIIVMLWAVTALL